MKLASRLIEESCGQLTCLKNANPLFGLSTIKPSPLVNGYIGEAKMAHVGATTTIQNRLNVYCGLARMQI